MLAVSPPENRRTSPHAQPPHPLHKPSDFANQVLLVLPAYALADTLAPAERAPKRNPFHNHQASSSVDSLSLSLNVGLIKSPPPPPHRDRPSTKPKRRLPLAPASAPPAPPPSSTAPTPPTKHPQPLPKLGCAPPKAPAPRPSTSFLARKSISSPLLFDLHTPAAPVPLSPPPYSPPYAQHTEHAAPPPHPRAPSPYTIPYPHMNSDTEDDNEASIIYTSRLGPRAASIIPSSIGPGSSSASIQSHNHSSHGGHHAYAPRPGPSSSSSQSLRSRIFALASSSAHASSSRVRDKPICTTPGVMCAGETETETDEPSRALPTARIIPRSHPLIPPSTLEQRLTPLLFEFARLLSIVPAVFGTLYNVWFLVWLPQGGGGGRPPPDRIDYFISALWAILTGYQCLALTTGLLTRWRLYYPPLPTLVRLLALQGICWPATHLTLSVLGHEVRPVVTWALIGTTTCCSRSVQIWVTSNLWWEKRGGGGGEEHGASADAATSTSTSISTSTTHPPQQQPETPSPAPAPVPRQTYWKRLRGSGGKWGGRRWDWREVGVKCALPAGVVYFVMAWAGEMRREFGVGAGGM